MKKIEIIPIARKKLERRRLSEEWIKETINRPDQIVGVMGGAKSLRKNTFLKTKNIC
jgi:hypothetical protein